MLLCHFSSEREHIVPKPHYLFIGHSVALVFSIFLEIGNINLWHSRINGGSMDMLGALEEKEKLGPFLHLIEAYIINGEFLKTNAP